MYSVIGFLPQFLQTPKSTGYGFGASIIQSGLYLLPLTVTMFIFGMLSGRIAAGIGSKAAVIIGSCFSLAVLPDPGLRPHPSPGRSTWPAPCSGVGLGLAFSAMSNLIVQAVPPAQTGVASGMNANIRTIGGAVGAAVMSSIVTRHPAAQRVPAAPGYTRGFAFLAAMTVVAIVAAVFIPTATSEAADADHEHHLQNAELAIVRRRHHRRRMTTLDRPPAGGEPPVAEAGGPTAPTSGRPALRRDAARNRDKILAAARAAFDEEGVDVGVEVIAQRAGVGVGTLYRRFPTKELLIEAVVDEVLARCCRPPERPLEHESPGRRVHRLPAGGRLAPVRARRAA